MIDPADHVKLVWFAARRLARPHEQFDEVAAECGYALVRACRTYRDTGGALFSTYAYVCMRHQVTRWRTEHYEFRHPTLKTRRVSGSRKRTRVRLYLFSEVGEPFVRGSANVFAADPPAPPDADTARAIEAALRGLHRRAAEVIRCRRLDCLTLDETARRLGITRERIRQIQVKAELRLADHPALRALAGMPPRPPHFPFVLPA